MEERDHQLALSFTASEKLQLADTVKRFTIADNSD